MERKGPHSFLSLEIIIYLSFSNQRGHGKDVNC